MLVYILNALWAENFRFEILLIAYNVLLQKLQRKNYFDISICFKNKLMLDEWYDEWKHRFFFNINLPVLTWLEKMHARVLFNTFRGLTHSEYLDWLQFLTYAVPVDFFYNFFVTIIIFYGEGCILHQMTHHSKQHKKVNCYEWTLNVGSWKCNIYNAW